MQIDIGANLTNKAFREDVPDVVARSRAAGVGAIVITGVSAPASRRAWEIASAHGLWSTAGVHPHHASTWSREIEADVRDLLAHPRTVAAGECGLDFDRDFSPRPAQRAAFEAQLAVAAELGKPVFLHERAAHEQFLTTLSAWRPRLKAAVVHCFTGQRAELEAYLALDLHIGLTGWICDERRGKHLEAIASLIPKGRLMIETDAPYIQPRDLRPRPTSRRNEPIYLPHNARVIAKHRGETFDDLAAHTTETARRFFGIR
jgi:TatD DNase family protein